jgi:hypothetical protein
MTEKHYVRVTETQKEDGSNITNVSIRDAEDEGVLLGSTIESKYFLTRRGYNKAISKEVESSLRFIGSMSVEQSISS